MLTAIMETYLDTGASQSAPTPMVFFCLLLVLTPVRRLELVQLR